MAREVDRALLRDMLDKYFGWDGLDELIVDLDFDPQNVAGQGITRRKKVSQLVEYAKQRGRLPELVDRAERRRRGADWQAVFRDEQKWRKAKKTYQETMASTDGEKREARIGDVNRLLNELQELLKKETESS